MKVIIVGLLCLYFTSFAFAQQTFPNSEFSSAKDITDLESFSDVYLTKNIHLVPDESVDEDVVSRVVKQDKKAQCTMFQKRAHGTGSTMVEAGSDKWDMTVNYRIISGSQVYSDYPQTVRTFGNHISQFHKRLEEGAASTRAMVRWLKEMQMPEKYHQDYLESIRFDRFATGITLRKERVEIKIWCTGRSEDAAKEQVLKLLKDDLGISDKPKKLIGKTGNTTVPVAIVRGRQ